MRRATRKLVTAAARTEAYIESLLEQDSGLTVALVNESSIHQRQLELKTALDRLAENGHSSLVAVERREARIAFHLE